MKKGSVRSGFVLFLIFGFGVPFALSAEAPAGPEDRDKDKYAIIDCWSKKFIPVGEARTDGNKVREGRKLKWSAYGPENTKVNITFGADSKYADCIGASPGEDTDPIEENIGSSEHAKMELKVRAGAGGTVLPGKCYVYKITCDGNPVAEEQIAPAAIDPIIEVPKR